MKISHLLGASLFLTSGHALCAAETPNHVTEEEAAGWRLLFDYRSLAGWSGYKTIKSGAGWKVEEGAITRVVKAGDLATEEEFEGVELSLEWKITDGTNSGVIYRVGLGDKEPWETGQEYQVLDNLNAHTNRDPIHQAAGLYDLVAPPKDATRPIGKWNQTRIVIEGWDIQHWLNGVKVVDVDVNLTLPELRALIKASKFKATPRFATLSRGRIDLQDHGDKVSFRNIKVRPLNRTSDVHLEAAGI